ncbi:MAG: hypothetical protein WCL51_11415 [Bacteroidota bacterium]
MKVLLLLMGRQDILDSALNIGHCRGNEKKKSHYQLNDESYYIIFCGEVAYKVSTSVIY